MTADHGSAAYPAFFGKDGWISFLALEFTHRMALGFGFNKAKVLASAEKCVQQGKLQNAIVEYTKIIREDPKDLNVLNTIGDLYVRLGNNSEAASYFRKVGDAYAADGFAVRAIAMFKKLTKIDPGAVDCQQRLAELYTAQGLYNDARHQYVQVADHCLKSGATGDAAKVLQKILELDPENTAMQSKLAGLYLKLGKKAEASNIYFTAAQSLFAKQAFDAAAEALNQVLSITPGNKDALLMRGQLAAEAGDATGAIQSLSAIPDIDSRPEALNTLLRAQLQLKNFDEAGPLATKLLVVHNDLKGITRYASALIEEERFVEALRIYEQFADKILAADPEALPKTLLSIIHRVKENSEALNLLSGLLEKAGETSNRAEIMELRAHAYVQEGNLESARDLYRQLAEDEPENPLHAQNYRQVIAKLGEDTSTRMIAAELGSQPFMLEELDTELPTIEVEYPAAVAATVSSALTDFELFDSYNLPAKAIPALLRGLQMAPRDLDLNFRLATLYAKIDRFADAAGCCLILEEVCAEHGFVEQSKRFAGLAAQYTERAATMPAPPPIPDLAEMETEVKAAPLVEKPPTAEATPDTIPFSASSLSGITFDQETAPDESRVMDLNVLAVGDSTAAGLSVTESAEPFDGAVSPINLEAETAAPATEVSLPAQSETDDWESMLFIETAPSVPAQPVPAPIPEPPPFPAPEPETIEVPEIAVNASGTFDILADAAGKATMPTDHKVINETSEAAAAEASATFDIVLEPELAMEVPTAQVPPVPKASPASEVVAKAAPVQPFSSSDDILGDLVTELEDSVGEDFGIRTTPQPAAPTAPPPAIPMAAAPTPTAPPQEETGDFLGDLVSELEDSLGDGFEPGIPEKPPATNVAVPAAMAASSAFMPPVMDTGTTSSEPRSLLGNNEAASALEDLFSEFKEDVEESAHDDGDIDTHYNLGIAFKEMGLLDEAIGELQKVCHAVDQGRPFGQVMQAYTWLAQCLVDKGVPQAAIRWYEQALKMPGLPEESRLAVYYDLACVHEMTGDQKSARDNFMRVYSSNIDYRDVAERIKTLKV